MNRREFLALSGMLGAGLVLNPVAIVRAADEDLEVLAKKYIPFMTKPVSVTLDPEETHVREVTPANYRRTIYGSKRSSLVFFMHQCEDDAPGRGLASVFRALDEKYHRQVDFFVYYKEKYPIAPRHDYQTQTMVNEGINATPSIAMYSPFDLLKGETQQKNNGKIKRVDILQGGPTKESVWSGWYEFLSEKWIPTNLTNPNGEYIWRFNNSINEKKINI